MITQGGFDSITAREVGYIGYWKMTGGKPAGQPTAITNEKEEITQAIDVIQSGLTNLIQCFEDKDTAYLAIPRMHNTPRFNDYEHLERIKEWAALDDQSEDAA